MPSLLEGLTVMSYWNTNVNPALVRVSALLTVNFKASQHVVKT